MQLLFPFLNTKIILVAQRPFLTIVSLLDYDCPAINGGDFSIFISHSFICLSFI